VRYSKKGRNIVSNGTDMKKTLRKKQERNGKFIKRNGKLAKLTEKSKK
jgi:hypothetical protein